MAEHDYIIANQTFPSYRNDHNNSLSAIVTKNSKATAPSTTYAYMWWYDTANDILKIRNADNDAWINFASFDQTNDNFSLTVQDLTVNGQGSIPSGTKMLFQQTTAPTGWTKDTTHNNKSLRIVNGSVGTGGVNSFTNAFNSSKTVSGTTGTSTVTITGSTAGHSITQAQLPDITLQTTQLVKMETAPAERGSSSGGGATYQRADVPLGGSNQAHSHSVSITSGSHSHSFSDTFNLDVQYVDFIIATKD
jgi:hypothetical protein